MATQLKGADVVIVGLGAAGGIAALPLAEAGLDVDWPRGRHLADPPRLRARRDSQQRARLAAGGAEGQSGGADAAARTPSRADHARRQPPDDERRRRHHAPLLGAELAAQSLGLQGASARPCGGTAARDCPRAPPSRTGRSATRSSSPTTTRWSGRPASPAAPATSRAPSDPRGNVFEGPRQRDYPMPPLRGTGFTDLMAAAARSLGWKPFAGPAQINSRSFQERSACMYHGFCNRGGCHVDAKNGTSRHHHPARARRPAASAS